MPSSATRKPKYQFHQIYHFLKDIYDILWKIFRYDIFVRVGCVGSRSSERSDQVRFLIQTHERKILSYKNFSLPKEEVFSSKQPKSACGKSSSFQFSFSTAKNVLIKPIEWVNFGFFFSNFGLLLPLGNLFPEKPTCQQLNGDIRYKRKTIVSFHARCYGFSQGRKSFCNTAV